MDSMSLLRSCISTYPLANPNPAPNLTPAAIPAANPTPAAIPAANSIIVITAKPVKTSTSSSTRNVMTWTDDKDVILCREVTLINPFQFKKGTKERGKSWTDIADNLRSHEWKVDQRAVRDRYNYLKNRTAKKNSDEKKASGINPEGTEAEKEINSMLEDLTQQEVDMENLPAAKGDEEQKRLDGIEMQKRCLETFSETRKRLNKDGEQELKRKRRNSGGDSMQFLVQMMQIRQDELGLRREEAERRRVEEDRRQEHQKKEEENRRREQLERDQRFELMMQQSQQTQNMMMLMIQRMSKGNPKGDED